MLIVLITDLTYLLYRLVARQRAELTKVVNLHSAHTLKADCLRLAQALEDWANSLKD